MVKFCECCGQEMSTEIIMSAKEGLVLLIPDKPNVQEITKDLLMSISCTRKLGIQNKKHVIALYETALRDFPAYPNRILRYYITENRGCPNDVNMDWKNPDNKIKKFSVYFNGCRT